MDAPNRTRRLPRRGVCVTMLGTALLWTGACADPTDPNSGESPTITTESLSDGAVGVAYSDVLTAIGGHPPYAWQISAGSLPAGLTLAPSTGELGGAPTDIGTSDFTVRVTGGDGLSSTKSLSLTIGPAPLEQLIGSLPDAVLDVDYEVQLQATGGDGQYSWSIVSGSLPNGLSLSGDVISGRPTETGYFPIEIRVESGGSTRTADHRVRVYPTLSLRIFLDRLPAWIVSSLEYNQESLPRNPQLASEIQAKIEMLSAPGLEASILNEALFGEGETTTLDGRSIPVAFVYPADTMRWGVQQDIERLVPTISTLEGFIGVPWPHNYVREWYGFRMGHSGGGGELYMEDRGTYADRGVPNDVIVPHELGHSYIGHEGLTQFLEVYGYNVVETGSTDLSTWTWTRSVGGGPYVPFAPENQGAWALMDIYQLIGRAAMGRAYARIHAIGAPYGTPLSEAARQTFVDEAPEVDREQVADIVLRL
jgi:hypothetical protein